LSSKYLEELLNLPVQTNMRLTPPTVSPSDVISTVVDMMIKENIGAIIVVDQDKPVGIITERDVLEKVVKTEKNLELMTAGEVMSQPLISIEADRPMRKALELMRKHNVRRLAVTKGGSLIGLATERRLLEVAFLVT
jgi:CBS domain-containing protein